MLGRGTQKVHRNEQDRPGSLSGFLSRLQRLGPYLLVELILPGGTLVALSMYVYRNRPALKAAFARVRVAV